MELLCSFVFVLLFVAVFCPALFGKWMRKVRNGYGTSRIDRTIHIDDQVFKNIKDAIYYEKDSSNG